MNKITLVYLLISIELFSSLLIEPNSRKEDTDLCKAEQNTTLCTSIILDTKDIQCCSVDMRMIIADQTIGGVQCKTLINPISVINNEMQTIKGKQFYQEYLAKRFYEKSTRAGLIQEIYNCSDGSQVLSFNSSTYSKEDESIIKSNNHCFKYSNRNLNVTKETCYSAYLTKPSTDAGLTCGYYEFELKFKDESSDKFSTCYIFNDDTITTKSLGHLIKSMFDNTVDEASEGKELSYYKVRFSNSKNQILIYDSSTGNIDYESESKSKSNFLNFKYLYFLLYLIF